MNFAIAVEDNFMADYFDVDISESEHPRIEIVVNFVLKLNIKSEPSSESAP